MITRLVKITLQPSEVENFTRIFNASAELIKAFDGCHGVKLMQDGNNTNVYFTVSMWQSENELNAYRSSELFKATWAKVKPLFSEKAEAWSLIESNPEKT